MLKKITSVFLILFSIWCAYETYFTGDSNRDIAYATIINQAYVFGDDDIVKLKVPSDISFKFKSSDFLELKKKILSKQFDNDKIISSIKHLKAKGERALLYALLSVDFLGNGDSVKSNNFALKSYVEIWGTKKYEIADFELEIANLFLDTNSKLLQELAAEIVLDMSESNEKTILMYKLIHAEYSKLKILNLKKKKDKRTNISSATYITNRAKYDLDRRTNVSLEKFFQYAYYGFQMPLIVKERNRFNYPLFAYIGYLYDNMERFKHYKSLSIAKGQFEAVKGGFCEYVEYGVKVFCLSGDIDSAIKLLDNFPEGHRKNLILKRTSKYLALKPEYIKKVMSSSVFKEPNVLEKVLPIKKLSYF